MLVPIKLMPKSANRNALLAYIKESSTIADNDYIESRIKTNPAAAKMLAIENASEMAKIMLQGPGVFETISRTIISECGCRAPINFQCNKSSLIKSKNNKSGTEIIHMSINLTNGGHYAGVVVNHNKKRMYLSDSMGFTGGEKETFINRMVNLFPSYKLNDESPAQGPQPTGGFSPKTLAQFKTQLNTAGIKHSDIHTAALEQMHEITQYDELSQHHFCYIESFIYICHKLLGTSMGNLNKSPRERIIFIKKVVWGLIHKYQLLDKVPEVVRNYFLTNFPLYMKLTTMNNRNIPLVGGLFHMPNLPVLTKRVGMQNVPLRVSAKDYPRLYKTSVAKIAMPTVTPATSLRRLIELASE